MYQYMYTVLILQQFTSMAWWHCSRHAEKKNKLGGANKAP